MYQRSNLLISDFRVCDSQTLDCLHKTYCMHMYGSELWNLNCNYVDELRVAWRKIKREYGDYLKRRTMRLCRI